jgi:hypothetical protein
LAAIMQSINLENKQLTMITNRGLVWPDGFNETCIAQTIGVADSNHHKTKFYKEDIINLLSLQWKLK